jgi:hypothetical protein
MIGAYMDPEQDRQSPPTPTLGFGASLKEDRVTMTPDLAERLPELEQQAEEYERKAQALRQIVAAVHALNGDADAILMHRSYESHRTSFAVAPLAPDRPRGPKAVLRVMEEHPERDWKVVELKREILRRGWAPSPKAVEASVKRLRQTGEIVPTSYGHYRLRPSGDEESAATEVQPQRPTTEGGEA